MVRSVVQVQILHTDFVFSMVMLLFLLFHPRYIETLRQIFCQEIDAQYDHKKYKCNSKRYIIFCFELLRYSWIVKVPPGCRILESHPPAFGSR